MNKKNKVNKMIVTKMFARGLSKALSENKENKIEPSSYKKLADKITLSTPVPSSSFST